jgi:hypothetical protein
MGNEAFPLDRHPRFRRLADYLAERAPHGKLCGRQHVDPVEIPDLLPYIVLVDVLRRGDAEPRFRYRLVGTEVAKRHGSDYTGKSPEEAFIEPMAGQIVASYRWVLAHGKPHYRSAVIPAANREFILHERIVFPLARDGATIDMLIGIVVYPNGDKVAD